MQLGALLVDVVRYMRTPRTGIVKAILSEPEFDQKDINRLSLSGWTPLMHAVCSGFPEVVGLLLGAGADPDSGRDKEGRTAIMIASEKGNIEIVKLLIEAGADLTVVDRRKRSLVNHNYDNIPGFLDFEQIVRAAFRDKGVTFYE